MYKSHLLSIRRSNKNPVPAGLRLHAGERSIPFSDTVWAQFRNTLTPEDFTQYPDDTTTRNKIAEYHNVNPDNVMLFSGADGVINCAVSCFSGRQIMYPEFHFPMYDVYATQNNLEPVLLKYQGMKLTSDTNAVITDLAMIIVSNPNSPIGDSPDHDYFNWLESFDVPIIVDSVYADFGCTKLNLNEKIEKDYIFAYSFSKSFGGAGARIGYAIASERMLEMMNKLRPMFGVTGPSLKFAQWALDNVALKNEYVSNTVDIRDRINEIYPWNIGGNWVHLPQTLAGDLHDLAFKSDVVLPFYHDKLIRISAAPIVLDRVLHATGRDILRRSLKSDVDL